MRIKAILIFCLMLSVYACDDFVAIDQPDSIIGTTAVFGSDATAIGAANSMYYELVQPYGFFGGILFNSTYATGMSGDEVVNYFVVDSYKQFYDNTLHPANDFVYRLWSGAYTVVYDANALIEGVHNNTKLSANVRLQLEGEGRFMRALMHFYLVNLFGDVPLITSTDYRVNASATRTPTATLYAQITEDLEVAKSLLAPEYFGDEKIRPNRYAATALLARVKLYAGEPAAAEAAATEVIESERYGLDAAGEVFLANSHEAIWQLSQLKPGNFPTGDAFIFTIFHDFFNRSLSPNLVQAFEADDVRKDAWIRTWIKGGNPYYYASKYRVRVSSDPNNFTEYLMVLRLAELYLIRAEARALQHNFPGAITDLNVIRERAGVPPVDVTDPLITEDFVLQKIANERRLEFFCEMSHRWMDLKRTERIDEVMAAVKPAWESSDALYPIPERELTSNPFLKPQNGGY